MQGQKELKLLRNPSCGFEEKQRNRDASTKVEQRSKKSPTTRRRTVKANFLRGQSISIYAYHVQK